MYATIVATHVGNLEYFSIDQYSRNYVAIMTNTVYCVLLQLCRFCMWWVATSYSGGVVNLYDSVYTGRLTPSLEKQMAEIYSPVIKDGMLPVTMVPFQQQVGRTDCGVFSIAAAYSAALGIEPHLVTFDADEIRGHLERCFENEKLTLFPSIKMPVQKCRGKHVFIHVYCVCGLPESYDTQMIECEQCQKWFHFKCMKLVTEPDSWVCPQCST